MSIVVGGKLNRILNQITVLLVIFVNGLRGENCSAEALEKCTEPLTLISSVRGMSLATQRQELDELCPQLYQGMICLRSYTRRCMTLDQRGHFLKLFHGSQQVVRELCREGPLQNEFLKHSSCLSSPAIINDYQQCATTYEDALLQVQLQQQNANQVPSNHTSNLVCCSFREYLACSETAVYKKCGWATASFTRKFMNQMAVPMIKEYCESNQEIVCDNKSTGSRSPAEFGTLIWLMMIMLVKMLLFC